MSFYSILKAQVLKFREETFFSLKWRERKVSVDDRVVIYALAIMQHYLLGVGIASENRIVIYRDFRVCIEIRITIYREP